MVTSMRMMGSINGQLLWLAVATAACNQGPEAKVITPHPVPEAHATAALDPGAAQAVAVYQAPGPRASGGKPAGAAPRPSDPVAKAPPGRPDAPKGPAAGPPGAMHAAMRELADIRADTRAIKAAEAELAAAQAGAPMGNIAAQLRTAEDRLAATSLAKTTEVEQVRRNQCCSMCGNTKTELEKTGKRFIDHLLEVKGTVNRCAPSKLSAVERKYEDQLASERAAVANLKAKAGPDSGAAQAKVAAAQAKLAQAKQEHEAKIKAAEAKIVGAGR